jgi:hypothetical protein
MKEAEKSPAVSPVPVAPVKPADPNAVVAICEKVTSKFGKKNEGTVTRYESPVCLTTEAACASVMAELNAQRAAENAARPERKKPAKTTRELVVMRPSFIVDGASFAAAKARKDKRDALKKIPDQYRAMFNLPSPDAPDSVIDAYQLPAPTALTPATPAAPAKV